MVRRKKQKKGKSRTPILVIGLLLLLGTLWTAYDTHQFIKYSKTTTGVVVDLAESTDNDGDTLYYPIIEFEAGDQLVYEFKSSESSYHDDEMGRKISVRYLITDPSDARINRSRNTWESTWFGFLLSMIFLVPYFLDRIFKFK
ncbi:DUF3592 domain-containing protein [Pleionea sp. CnH1-48]|uniref:DUF3592 domain-containing protein n=1 Tax=Pleionea sp. CnH1-48 TaxID=2954494 RepID=UPI002096B011|nr:DUF3592 domain-containing protein [Pleionea sp. CnH1-48]MCO7224131.1 DUF3592 domain-containing protein [Pleionea sp. CnH1-48]